MPYKADRWCWLILLLAGCQKHGDAMDEAGRPLSGRITVSGSSNVYLISDPLARNFRKRHPGVWIVVEHSSSGEGLTKLVAGQCEITGSSRPIKDAEKKKAAENGIQIVEVLIAHDAVVAVVPTQNTWVNSLSMEELTRLWRKDSDIRRWSDLRPDWPMRDIRLFGPVQNGGTYATLESAFGPMRADYTRHDDDAELARQAMQSPDSLLLIGLGYQRLHSDHLRLVAIAEKQGTPVLPTSETIGQGQYRSLSRRLYLYVNQSAADHRTVRAFIRYYLDHAGETATRAGLVPLAADEYQQLQKQWAKEP